MKFWHLVAAWLVALSIGGWMVVSGPLRGASAAPAQGDAQVRLQQAPEHRARPVAPAQPSRPSVARLPAGAPTQADAAPAEGALGEWETFQRDARHTGYVPARFDPDLFVKKWEWQRFNGGEPGAISSVATAAGYVVVSADQYFGSPALRVMREIDGSPVWEQVFEDYYALNPPAASNGAVYVTTSGHEKTFLWAFAVVDGTPLIQASFSSQWANLLAPTVHGGRVYVSSGYYWDTLYAFDAVAGDRLWTADAVATEMSTPAVDDVRAVHYGSQALDVYDVATGEPTVSIPDPYVPEPHGGFSYHGAPMMGGTDSVTAFSGTDYYGGRYLVNFSIDEARARWRSQRRYSTQPAVVDGVLYAGSNNPKSFDAIDEATGRVLWSWVPPPEDVSFHRNVVVTDNLVFVSTNRAVYALDRTSRRPVWSYPVPGMLAISGGGTLYIVEGALQSTGRLVAISLTRHWLTGGPGPRHRR
jgi:outer membrane protein assembly factor BamB